MIFFFRNVNGCFVVCVERRHIGARLKEHGDAIGLHLQTVVAHITNFLDYFFAHQLVQCGAALCVPGVYWQTVRSNIPISPTRLDGL